MKIQGLKMKQIVNKNQKYLKFKKKSKTFQRMMIIIKTLQKRKNKIAQLL